MDNFKLPLSTVAAMILLLAGCRVIDSGQRAFSPPASADEQDKQRNESIRLGNGILEAFRDRDFSRLRQNTPGDLADQMREQDFLASWRNFSEKFGRLKSFHFLTPLSTPAFNNLIWIVTFIRSGTDGRPIEQQLLFRLVTIQVDEKVQVVSYGFL